jgi:hypothetical protein
MKRESEIYKTLLVICAGFIVLYLSFHSVYFLYIGLGIAIISFLSAYAAQLISGLWMKLGVALSYIIPPIIMTLLFFLILTPMAVLQKLFKKNKSFPFTNDSKSTFIEANKLFSKAQFEKPW